MAESVGHKVVQAIRQWIMSEIGLSNDEVIPADASGPRPDLPYLTVKALVSNIPVGEDFIWTGVLDESEEPYYQADGLRRATINIRGFGKQAQTWLENLEFLAELPRSLETLDTVGLSIIQNGGIQDLTSLRDSDMEAMYLQEFEVVYRIQSDPIEAIEASQFQIDIELVDETNPPINTPGLIGDIDISFTPENQNLRRFGQPLNGDTDDANLVFESNTYFVHNGLHDESVFRSGQRQLHGMDYVAEESGGVGTGYDTIRFLSNPPEPGENITIDFYPASV